MTTNNVAPPHFNLAKNTSARMSVLFEEGKASLSKGQLDVLHQWVLQWFKQRKSSVLAIGGARKTSRAGMLRRVHHLLKALFCLGVCGKQIKQDDQWTQPAKMGAVDDLPPDTVWLELKPVKMQKTDNKLSRTN